MCTKVTKDPSPGPGENSRKWPHWSEIEDSILKQAVARYGVNRWDDVARLIWTRKSADECRERWAELVPLLHDDLARRESDPEEQKLRKRSVTASAEISTSKHQQTSHLQAPSLLQGKDQHEGEGLRARAEMGAGFFTEPSSPVPQTPATESPLSPNARTRRNTEPGARPSRAATAPHQGDQQHEWLAPHPLMPGRFRRRPMSTRNASTPRDNGTTRKPLREVDR